MSPHFPPWLKKRFPASGDIAATREILKKMGLNTVCQSALCPNLGECFARKTATFMILGNTCTRNCRFCAVEGGETVPVDPEEPSRIAEAVEKLGLRHAVITSVTRDDLPDGGAGHFVASIKAIRTRTPQVVVEVLTPDFAGKHSSIDLVITAHPDIYNHNVETVPRLYPRVRPQAGYLRSLALLERVKVKDETIFTKSGLMVGLGESFAEVRGVMQNLRDAGCDIITIGQYLRPSPAHLDVVEYVPPEAFEDYRAMGEEMGFLHVAAGPFVRSSFNAQEFSDQHMNHASG
ncbi:lipoyl synthase [Clostridiales bacterium PH28_bin88]|nr:lipoyl synthase [Clostridiales bacterium PH28_bin88]